MRRLILTLSPELEAVFFELLPAMERLSKSEANIVIEDTTLGAKPSVQYRALAGADALTALGEHTVNGIIFKHLLENGPCTVKQIREAKPYTDKAVQSVIHRLKHMSLVHAEPLGTQL